jgi:transposase
MRLEMFANRRNEAKRADEQKARLRKIAVPWPSGLQYAGEEPENTKNRAFYSNAELLEAYFHKHGHIMLHHEKDKVLHKIQNRSKKIRYTERQTENEWFLSAF